MITTDIAASGRLPGRVALTIECLLAVRGARTPARQLVEQCGRATQPSFSRRQSTRAA
ncbi:MAG TPA: hypothetical protein VIF84_00365 [Candidatus Limnocylindrales bacterium]